MKLATNLVVRGLRLNVSLGCGEAERRVPQPVDVDIAIRFESAPRGCETDELADTACYDVISSALTVYCSGKSFKLVENLGRELYAQARALVANEHAICVRVHKLHPPVENLKGGVLFTYGEWTPQW